MVEFCTPPKNLSWCSEGTHQEFSSFLPKDW